VWARENFQNHRIEEDSIDIPTTLTASTERRAESEATDNLTVNLIIKDKNPA